MAGNIAHAKVLTLDSLSQDFRPPSVGVSIFQFDVHHGQLHKHIVLFGPLGPA